MERSAPKESSFGTMSQEVAADMPEQAASQASTSAAKDEMSSTKLRTPAQNLKAMKTNICFSLFILAMPLSGYQPTMPTPLAWLAAERQRGSIPSKLHFKALLRRRAWVEFLARKSTVRENALLLQ